MSHYNILAHFHVQEEFLAVSKARIACNNQCPTGSITTVYQDIIFFIIRMRFELCAVSNY